MVYRHAYKKLRDNDTVKSEQEEKEEAMAAYQAELSGMRTPVDGAKAVCLQSEDEANDAKEEVQIVRRILAELLDNFAYDHQNPLVNGFERCPPATRVCG